MPSSEHHRVCSQHFQGGKKQESSDVPAIVPLLPQPKQRKASKLREAVLPREKKKRRVKMSVTSKPLADGLVEEVSYLCELVSNVTTPSVPRSISPQPPD